VFRYPERSTQSPFWVALFLLILGASLVKAQVIEFWSNGLRYQALTREGLTVMYARMPLAVRDYVVVQVALNNGSQRIWKVQPTDFYFESASGLVLRAESENEVVARLYRQANSDDVIKLQTAYERATYGNQHIRSNNGYEKRRQAALAFGGHQGIKAAAAASAIAFVKTELLGGDSTDGAIFFEAPGRQLGAGRVIARVEEETFEFRVENPTHAPE
jgi:hypothetical protein